jgi:hypothetical protein
MPAGIGYGPEALGGVDPSAFFQFSPQHRQQLLQLRSAQGLEMSPEELTLLSLLGQRPEVRTTAQTSRMPVSGQPQQPAALQKPSLWDMIFGLGGVTPALDTTFKDAFRRGGVQQ